MWEGIKRDQYRRILVNHGQMSAELAEERAKNAPLDEVETQIEYWSHRNHSNCDCWVPSSVWQAMLDDCSGEF